MKLTATARRLAAVTVIAAAGIGTVAPVVAAAPAPELGLFTDNDTASIIAGSVRVRSCLTNGTANLQWTYNSATHAAAAKWTSGCISIVRNGATQSRLVAEYRRVDGSVAAVKTLNCNKPITVNPVWNCALNVLLLDAPFIVNLDKVVLKLKTVSPAGPEVTQTLVVGD